MDRRPKEKAMYRLFARWFRSRAAGRRPAGVRLSVERLDERVLPAHVFLPLAPPGTGGSPGIQVAAEANPHAGGFKAFEIKDFSFSVENPSTIGSATSGAGAGAR